MESDSKSYLRISPVVFTVACALLYCLAVPGVPAAPVESKPNIILFLADDMGYGDTTVFNPDSKIAMPAIEQLAAEGMSFTNAHATPKCAPTRYTLLSGNYHRRGNSSWGAWDYRGGSQILPEQWTFARSLKDHGYNTAIVGKWHLGADFYIKNSDLLASTTTPETDIDFGRGVQNGPLKYGFNYSYVLLRGIQDSPYAFFENDMLVGNPDDMVVWPPGIYGDSRVNVEGIGSPDWDSSQAGPILMEKAIAFVDSHLNNNVTDGTDKPFFLYYASQAPHGPWTPPEFFHGQPVRGVTGLGLRADMVYENDIALAMLLSALEERGLTNDTLLIFASDNGAQRWSGGGREVEAGHAANGELRGYKGEIWEGGHRVPMIVKWGDGTVAGSKITPGSSSDQPVGLHDIMATLSAIVGARLPADQAFDSFNLYPLMTGDQAEDQPIRDYLLLEAREFEGSHVLPHFAILDSDWKLIFNPKIEAVALYNLKVDPSETRNLIDDPVQATHIARMSERFFQLIRSSRTAPLLPGSSLPLMGKPAYVPGLNGGVYLWKETFDGPYHLAVNGNGGSSDYTVDILATHPFDDVIGSNLETDDLLDWSENRLHLQGQTTTSEDGIHFTVPAGTVAIMTVTSSNDAVVNVGAEAITAQHTAWYSTVSALPQPRQITPGTSLGFYIGKMTGGPLSIRWSGDSTKHIMNSTLIFTELNPAINPVDFEPSSDRLSTTAYSATVEAHVDVGYDGLNIMLNTPDSNFGMISYHDGGIRPDLVNPGNGDLTLPNAFEIPRPQPFGKPAYNLSLDKGIFIWKDESGTWHMRASPGGTSARYTGSIRGTLAATWATAVALENDDIFSVSADGKEITFDLQTQGLLEDGVDFKFPENTKIILDLNNNSAEAAALLRIGDAGWPIEQLPIELTR